MPDALSLTDLEGQHVELLPPRTVLSLFTISAKHPMTCDQYGNCNDGGTQTNSTGPGGSNSGNETYGGTQTNTAGGGVSGSQG